MKHFFSVIFANQKRLGVAAGAALLTASLVVVGSFDSAAAQITDSFVDTLYVDTIEVPGGQFDAGDTVWVGVGLVNTFAVSGVGYRLEVADTTKIRPIFSSDAGSYPILMRLVNRGLAFDKPNALTPVVVRHPDTTNVITGLLIDFDGTANIPVGRGTIIELAFICKTGITTDQNTTIRVRDDLTRPIEPRNNLSDRAHHSSYYPRLRDGFVQFGPGPVIFTVGTNNGNDTVYVGVPGSIRFNVDAQGNLIQGMVFPFELVFTGGNWIGPIEDAATPGPPNNVVPSALAIATFASIAWNSFYGNGTDPDSMLYGFTSFGGPWTFDAEVFRINVTPTGPGTVFFRETPLPPAGALDFLDPLGASTPYIPHMPTITSDFVPPMIPDCNGATGPGTVVFGDPASGTLFGSDSDHWPQPLSFVLLSAVNSNGTGPNNPIAVVGDTWTHNTSSANQDDVGHWTLTFVAFDGMSQSQSQCVVEYDVIAEQPLICFSFGCVEAFSGSDICVPLNATDYFNPCIELGGFDLLFKYDASLLTFKGIDVSGSILESQDWEYLTYRVVSSNPALIRIVAIADMNNSNDHPDGWCLDGLLANICFRTTNDRNLACQSAWLMFYWEDCGDNTASSRDGNHLYIVADPAGGTYVGGNAAAVPPIPGGGILMSSCGIDAQIFSGDGGTTGPEDHPCPNSLPNKPDPEQLLCFVNGKIKIICPGDIDDRGDINLNGLAYEIADAVLYSNYFILGPQVFAPGTPGEAQVAASDINADGTPLTVADLVYLIRVITGDAQPIAGDILGGGPKVTAGQLLVTSAQQGANVTVSAKSDADLGAGLFVFNYSGSDIAGVSAMGRASSMDVSWKAEGGQLRVLVLPRMSGSQADQHQLVAAGNGPILNITTHGATVELVSVEAATFMGSELETQMEAKVLPTQFALKQNFPNPFNPSTSLAIDFPNASDYKLTIFNISGQTVRTFSGHSEAGTVTLIWDGRDARGSQVATGVYFYSVEAGAFKDVRRMALLK